MECNIALQMMADMLLVSEQQEGADWWEKYHGEGPFPNDSLEQFYEAASKHTFDLITKLLNPTIYVLWGNWHQQEAHSSVHSIYTEAGLPAMLEAIRGTNEGSYTSLAVYQQKLDDKAGMRLWLFSADPKTGRITTWNPKQETECIRVWKLMDPSGNALSETLS